MWSSTGRLRDRQGPTTPLSEDEPHGGPPRSHRTRPSAGQLRHPGHGAAEDRPSRRRRAGRPARRAAAGGGPGQPADPGGRTRPGPIAGRLDGRPAPPTSAGVEVTPGQATPVQQADTGMLAQRLETALVRAHPGVARRRCATPGQQGTPAVNARPPSQPGPVGRRSGDRRKARWRQRLEGLGREPQGGSPVGVLSEERLGAAFEDTVLIARCWRVACGGTDRRYPLVNRGQLRQAKNQVDRARRRRTAGPEIDRFALLGNGPVLSSLRSL
jgi:hypothetical protein